MALVCEIGAALVIAAPADEFTFARYRRAVADRIAELRSCGLFVTVVEDFDVAALVDIRPDGEPPTRMLVDPNNLISPPRSRDRSMSAEHETAIRDLHANGLKPRDIAAQLGLHEQQVREVLGIPRPVHIADGMYLRRSG